MRFGGQTQSNDVLLFLLEGQHRTPGAVATRAQRPVSWLCLLARGSSRPAAAQLLPDLSLLSLGARPGVCVILC